MAYFTTTELGREVQLDDWFGFHRDRLLAALYQLCRQGHPKPGFRLSMIAAVTGLEEGDARELVNRLVADDQLVEDGGVYRLTPEGQEWVRASPAA